MNAGDATRPADDCLLTGARILLIEDDFLVGQVTVELLEEEGAVVLGPIGFVNAALDYIGEHGGTIDYVVLDLNLHGEKSYPVADMLVRCDVPFVFTTGYGADAIEEEYRTFPRCMKPVTRGTLLSMIVPR